MQSTTRIAAVITVIVVAAALFAVTLTYSDLRYLTDGERGLQRVDLEHFWRVRVPLAVGLGGLTAAVSIGLIRAVRRRSSGETYSVLGSGALGLVAFVAFFSFMARLAEDPGERLHRPLASRSFDAFAPVRWKALAEQSWRGERPMGPLLELGPGLRDFRGYVPFEPCVLRRVTFLGLRREQVEHAIGPPIPTLYTGRQYLMYRMVEPPPRGRIATLVLALEDDEKRGPVVSAENLYPERVSAGCP